ncbi:hypothetical protein M408DRAFT_24605 [Serendipita vermifera MAFF 305830]|uniref:HEAT repeat protein n=1 Tax=Serendipita vermifera MAFF 305830 TaxID=933852 RepID=A0A0C2WM72_SERVB|nr:hypothetical protein M408DRAFT_24605 [Serendipita vermifera MAFF 305830]
MLDDEAHWMQSNAVDALSTLAEHTEFRNAIFPVIPQMIDMLDGKEYSVRSSTVEALHKLAELTRCRNPIPRRDGFKMDWSPII